MHQSSDIFFVLLHFAIFFSSLVLNQTVLVIPLSHALMTEIEETREANTLTEKPCEETSLVLVDYSKINQDPAKESRLQWPRRKPKNRQMNKATEMPKAILNLQDEKFRESALRKLSNFLLERREEDPDNYYSTGHMLFNSCSTMTILLQELLTFFRLMDDGSLTARASKRLTNVLTLFQCIAAGKETRHKFVKTLIPNFLVPIVTFRAPLEEFENVRAVALSVIGILCQARESNIIRWAVESNMVEVCRISVEIGNELSKVVGMYVIEAILQNDSGLSYICNPKSKQLKKLMATWYHLVKYVDVDQGFSPRLLFHVIRCCFLLCNNSRGYDMIRESLPDPILNGSFRPITDEFPVIGSLLQQLLLTIDKVDSSSTASQCMISEGPSVDNSI